MTGSYLDLSGANFKVLSRQCSKEALKGVKVGRVILTPITQIIDKSCYVGQQFSLGQHTIHTTLKVRGPVSHPHWDTRPLVSPFRMRKPSGLLAGSFNRDLPEPTLKVQFVETGVSYKLGQSIRNIGQRVGVPDRLGI